MWGCGRTIDCTGKEYSHGRMDPGMKDGPAMDGKRGTGLIYPQMEYICRGFGKEDSWLRRFFHTRGLRANIILETVYLMLLFNLRKISNKEYICL